MMDHNAQKILFTEFAEIKQGDGKGPRFEAGKAYWLSPDQAERWKAEGVAENAPEDMAADNEPVLTLRHNDVRLARAGHNRYDVLGPNGMKFNDAPLSAHDAELLRKRILEQGPPPSVTRPGPPIMAHPRPILGLGGYRAPVGSPKAPPADSGDE